MKASIISKGLESLQNFEVKRATGYFLILFTEQIEGIFRSFAIISERTLLMSALYLELQRFYSLRKDIRDEVAEDLRKIKAPSVVS